MRRLRWIMPTPRAKQRARRDARQGKAPTTQAGEFVREEVEKEKRGTGRAKSPKQAIAIGLSEARRAGVKVPPPKKGQASEATRRKAKRDVKVGRKSGGSRSHARSRK